MLNMLNNTNDLVEEKQLKVLCNFNKELGFEMFDEHDSLNELLSMKLEDVVALVKSSYEDYIEEEGWSPEVAKIKALEDFTLWYYGNEDKELSLREKVDEF